MTRRNPSNSRERERKHDDDNEQRSRPVVSTTPTLAEVMGLYQTMLARLTKIEEGVAVIQKKMTDFDNVLSQVSEFLKEVENHLESEQDVVFDSREDVQQRLHKIRENFSLISSGKDEIEQKLRKKKQDIEKVTGDIKQMLNKLQPFVSEKPETYCEIERESRDKESGSSELKELFQEINNHLAALDEENQNNPLHPPTMDFLLQKSDEITKVMEKMVEDMKQIRSRLPVDTSEASEECSSSSPSHSP